MKKERQNSLKRKDLRFQRKQEEVKGKSDTNKINMRTQNHIHADLDAVGF